MVVKKDGGYVVLPIKFQPFLRFYRTMYKVPGWAFEVTLFQPFLRFNNMST